MKDVIKTKGLFPDLGVSLNDFWDPNSWFPEDLFRSRFNVFPAVNITNNDDHFAIEMAAPGLEKEDFNIEIHNGLLTISAEKSSSDEMKEEHFTRREYNYNRFKRTFSVPDVVDSSDVEAKYANGVLRISLTKKETNHEPKHRVNVD